MFLGLTFIQSLIVILVAWEIVISTIFAFQKRYYNGGFSIIFAIAYGIVKLIMSSWESEEDVSEEDLKCPFCNILKIVKKTIEDWDNTEGGCSGLYEEIEDNLNTSKYCRIVANRIHNQLKQQFQEH